MSKGFDREEVQTVLDGIVNQMAGEADRGEAANYIPELADVSLNQFGIAVAPLDGPPILAGDAEVAFSIQSISKVFGLVVALQCMGATLWRRVGREPSGDPFNSIVQLEFERGKPRNPFINAGAIVAFQGDPATGATPGIKIFHAGEQAHHFHQVIAGNIVRL